MTLPALFAVFTLSERGATRLFILEVQKVQGCGGKRLKNADFHSSLRIERVPTGIQIRCVLLHSRESAAN